jgi:hypothetical protein
MKGEGVLKNRGGALNGDRAIVIQEMPVAGAKPPRARYDSI